MMPMSPTGIIVSLQYFPERRFMTHYLGIWLKRETKTQLNHYQRTCTHGIKYKCFHNLAICYFDNRIHEKYILFTIQQFNTH